MADLFGQMFGLSMPTEEGITKKELLFEKYSTNDMESPELWNDAVKEYKNAYEEVKKIDLKPIRNLLHKVSTNPYLLKTEDGKTLQKETVETLLQKMKDVEAQAKAILDKKSINKSDRSNLLALIQTAKRFLIDSAPFAVQSFSEAKEKVVSSAKAEIDAFMTHAVQSAGIKALKEKEVIAEEPETLLLEE